MKAKEQLAQESYRLWNFWKTMWQMEYGRIQLEFPAIMGLELITVLRFVTNHVTVGSPTLA